MRLKQCHQWEIKSLIDYQLHSILKSRDITLPTKFHLVKAMVFPVDMYGCESWTVKKAECWRIDAFELWCWRRLLRVPWTARRSNQSDFQLIWNSDPTEIWIFIGMTDAKAETPVLWSLDMKNWSLEKTLMLGKIEGRRRRGWQRMKWLDGITTLWTWVWAGSKSWWWIGKSGMLQSMGLQRVGHDWVTELNWEIKSKVRFYQLDGLLPEQSVLVSQGSCQKLTQLGCLKTMGMYSLTAWRLCCVLCSVSQLWGSFVCGILQARRLEWVAIPFCRQPSLPRDRTWVSCIWRQILYCQDTREAPMNVVK